MSDLGHIAPFTVATLLLSASAFDKGLHFQMELKDDASLALWAGMGLETITLSAVLAKVPKDAFPGQKVPSVAELEKLEFRTRPFPELAGIAASTYLHSCYPPSGRAFMQDVRNKMLHVGSTSLAGLVGPTLRVIRDVGTWLQGVVLPFGVPPGKMYVLEMDRLEDLSSALETAAKKAAADNVDHLEWSLETGAWDDTPELKGIALRELAECRELS